MDFATIGKLGSYVKTKNLTFAAKHKIRTGQTLTNSNGNLISVNTSTFDKLREAAKTSTNQAKQQKLARIRQKLKAGQKLTDEELGFLRVNDTKTYKKAKAADDAREELKSELKKAKTKGEAREAMTRAMVKASSAAMSELSALGQGGGGATNFSGANVQAGGEISAENISGGIDSSPNAAQSQTPTENNFNQADANQPNAEKNSDADKNTPEDIMEKYIWTIRALEDEWAHFTNSKTYKDLPDHDAKKIIIDRRLLNAAQAYRKAMTA